MLLKAASTLLYLEIWVCGLLATNSILVPGCRNQADRTLGVKGVSVKYSYKSHCDVETVVKECVGATVTIEISTPKERNT